ncbi:MAG: hypothetical protein CVU89_14400 [Firmicutes bacterium HGW-Firmicutes-14]|nr:MAG: hypothetical protein CVU89_14400 [Firmicutes bacterium HGW-Firmicutes-14]
MLFQSLFKAGYPFDRGPHGILMKYLQHFRYFTFVVTGLWFILVLCYDFHNSAFSVYKIVILFTIVAVYVVMADLTTRFTYKKCPDNILTLIKLLGIADILVISAGVFVSGGTLSPFVLVYLFPLTNFRIVYGNKGSFIVAGICLMSYFLALGVSPVFTLLRVINFLVIVVPTFFAYTYYMGLILTAERDSRIEREKTAAVCVKTGLLYRLSKDINQAGDYRAICDRVFDAINPVVPVKGMKVFFDEAGAGNCREVYSYETEQVKWSVNILNCHGSSGPEVLRSINSCCGFFVLPLAEENSSGFIVLRGDKGDFEPAYYWEYLMTVAEIAAAGFKNLSTLKRLHEQSISDRLTGLLNNHCFHTRLDELVNRAKRYKFDFVLAMLDIDHFKAVNDRYGHVFGDEVLKKCARIINQTARTSDLAARYGGEEFAVIMPHTDLAGAQKLMERVRQLVEEEVFKNEGIDCRVTISIGLCAWKSHMSATDLVKAADHALYTAKNRGRNRVVCGVLSVHERTGTPEVDWGKAQKMYI